jgi:hypothetical protein
VRRPVAIPLGGEIRRALRWRLFAMCLLLAACSSPPETTFDDFLARQSPLNDDLLAELSDGSPTEQFDWRSKATDEVNWLAAHPAAPCYAALHSLWQAAMKELSVGGDPSTGDAVGRYVVGAEEAYRSSDTNCPTR